MGLTLEEVLSSNMESTCMYRCPLQQSLALPPRAPLRSVFGVRREKNNRKDGGRSVS
ncbi:Uncharacterized protein DAT39_021846 [Clarias magur]|uniref:Uncharacterized protein n=1 Tax=Clarias magur TaxID=1594786 RepID=A0A8J4WPV1_CLAMG|nr:Uncharacterized protein DAT39_021846 [Clarias magur]